MFNEKAPRMKDTMKASDLNDEGVIELAVTILSGLARDLEMAGRIAELAAEQGGRAWFVGGYVRDALCGRENKDIDMEVHGLTPSQLEALLDHLGQRLSMGESFGIYALRGTGFPSFRMRTVSIAIEQSC